MGLFDKIFGTTTKTSDDQQAPFEESEHSSGVKEKALEFAVGNVRKYYNKKSQYISKIAKIKRECSFFDRTLNSKEIELKNNAIEELQKQVSSKNQEIAKKREEQEICRKAVLKYQTDIIQLHEKVRAIPSYNTAERQNLENEINKLEKYRLTMQSEFERHEVEVQEIVQRQMDLKRSVEEAAQEALVLISSDPECNIIYCNNLIAKHQLNTDYTHIVIPAIEAYRMGDFGKAFDLLQGYCPQREPDNFYICFIFGKMLFDIKRYSNSKKFLEYAATYLPQSKDIHQMLERVYHETSDPFSLRTEKEINKLLEV